eukprot:176475-Chlamydomonas_euryale.AAC.3
MPWQRRMNHVCACRQLRRVPRLQSLAGHARACFSAGPAHSSLSTMHGCLRGFREHTFRGGTVVGA